MDNTNVDVPVNDTNIEAKADDADLPVNNTNTEEKV